MKTININGKEYTENEFTRKCKKHKILLDGSLSMIFDELKEKFARQQPEPPTLRPMSELPKGNVNIVALYDNIITGRFWEDASSHDWGVELNKGGIFRKSENYINCYKQRLLGWIPSIELPNPDEMKLPC
jgi:hypothetical protein